MARLTAHEESEIAAPIETTWEVLTAIGEWPTWNPEVKAASLDDGLAEGSVFRWKAGPGTITSTIQQLDPPRLIAWTGKTLGIRASHVWHLEPRDTGTFVRTEESFEGLIAGIFRRPLRKILERALADGVRYLKAEAERRAGR